MKYSITPYSLTRRIGQVYGHDNKTLTTEQAALSGIEMVKCESISNGTYKIFVADTQMLYKNCGHIYAADKKSMFETSASVKLNTLTQSQIHWILAYCFYNDLVVIFRDGSIVVSIYETQLSLDDGSNLSEHSQHFKVLFKDFKTIYTGTSYDSNGKATQTTLNDYHDIIRYFQYKSKRKQITPDCYIKG